MSLFFFSEKLDKRGFIMLVLLGIIILTLDECLHKHLLTVGKCYVTLFVEEYKKGMQNGNSPSKYI